jgi:HK97 family phage prohead protease
MSSRDGRAEEVRQYEFRASEGTDGQTLEGYATVYNTWADIRDAKGPFRERILPGAARRSLGQKMPVMQFDHGTHPLIGSIPIGVYSVAREDRNGIFVRGRLSDNWLTVPVRDAIRDGAVTGMSIRMRVVKDSWGVDEEGNDTRDVEEMEVLEGGPVVWPAYTTTSVAVRSLVGALDEETRTELVRELSPEPEPVEVREDENIDRSTSPVVGEPATDDSPDEPPVASHETPRNRMDAVIARWRPPLTTNGAKDVA